MSGCVPGENGTEEEEGEEGGGASGIQFGTSGGRRGKSPHKKERKFYPFFGRVRRKRTREKRKKKKRREDIVPYNLKEVAESPSTLSDDRRRSVRLALIQEWIGETECGSQIVLWLWAQGLPPSEEEEEAPTGLEEGGACWREPSGSGRSSKLVR